MSTGTRRLEIEEVGDVTVAKFIDKKILDEGNIQIIGKLITMDKKVKAAKGKLRLCAIRPDIYEVFAITKLNRLFDMKDNLEAALEGL